VTIIGLIVTLVIIGLLLHLVNRFIPMDASIKTILNVVVIILVVLWLLSLLGGPLLFLNRPLR
jgi:hypothetical protein